MKIIHFFLFFFPYCDSSDEMKKDKDLLNALDTKDKTAKKLKTIVKISESVSFWSVIPSYFLSGLLFKKQFVKNSKLNFYTYEIFKTTLSLISAFSLQLFTRELIYRSISKIKQIKGNREAPFLFFYHYYSRGQLLDSLQILVLCNITFFNLFHKLASKKVNLKIKHSLLKKIAIGIGILPFSLITGLGSGFGIDDIKGKIDRAIYN